MLDLQKLTSNQVVKAYYMADIAFNEIKFFTYDKDRNSFVLKDDVDFEYNLQHIAFDEDFKVFLVEYDTKFDEKDWNWDTPNTDKNSKVTYLNKENIVQLNELLFS